MYVHTCRYTHVRTHVYVHTCTYTHACTHMHVHTCTYTHARSHIHVHTCTCTHVGTHMYVHTCTFTHTCTHMLVHTFTYTHVRTHMYVPVRVTTEDNNFKAEGYKSLFPATRAATKCLHTNIIVAWLGSSRARSLIALKLNVFYRTKTTNWTLSVL